MPNYASPGKSRGDMMKLKYKQYAVSRVIRDYFDKRTDFVRILLVQEVLISKWASPTSFMFR